VWVDQTGAEAPVTATRYPYSTPRLSLGDQKIAYVTAGREYQVWIYDLSKATYTRVTSEGKARHPIWAPDGKRLLFAWHRSLAENLFMQVCDSSLPMERLTTSQYRQLPASWSSDGKTVAFVELHPDSRWDIAALDMGLLRVAPLLNSRFDEVFPEFSPDGRWMAYTSDESNRFEVYVSPLRGLGMKHQVSSEGGTEPLWERNGKQLFYRRGDQIWVADVQTDDGFSTSKPRMLFERTGMRIGFPLRSWDVSPNGKRFLMVKLEERQPTPVTELIFVQNWFEELKRLCPTTGD
jgi:Tol biopolymer transport system component